MVTGGVDSPIAPLILRGFQLMRIMTTQLEPRAARAPRGPSRSDRDGFVIAEGSWFFVMEEMEQAKARGAHIYGEIAGYGSTCEAYHRVRLEECGEEPARAIGMALEEGGITPSDVQYISYHGTSTELNDRIETRAVKLAFDGHAYKLAGSSLKSMIGHPQGACGAAGIAATLLAMRDGVVPPTINVDEPDPNCDLDYVPDIGRKLAHRARGGQLHRLRQQELRHAPAPGVKSSAGDRPKKTADTRRKAPACFWSAEINDFPPDQVAKTSYNLYDVGRFRKVAGRGVTSQRQRERCWRAPRRCARWGRRNPRPA